jgi:hypothetical protein
VSWGFVPGFVGMACLGAHLLGATVPGAGGCVLVLPVSHDHAASYILNQDGDRDPFTGGDSSVNMVAIGTVGCQSSGQAEAVTERKRSLAMRKPLLASASPHRGRDR